MVAEEAFEIGRKYCPQFLFHQDENLFPISYTDFIDFSGKRSEVDSIGLVKFTSGRQGIDLPDDVIKLSRYPVKLDVCRIHLITFEIGSQLILMFSLLYLGNHFNRNRIGTIHHAFHEGDWETVALRFDISKSQLESAWGSFHGDDRCLDSPDWCAANLVKRNNSSPVVAVGLGTHSNNLIPVDSSSEVSFLLERWKGSANNASEALEEFWSGTVVELGPVLDLVIKRFWDLVSAAGQRWIPGANQIIHVAHNHVSLLDLGDVPACFKWGGDRRGFNATAPLGPRSSSRTIKINQL